VLLIGWGIVEARKGNPEHLVGWRWVKVISAMLGVVGLVILLANIDKTIRDMIGGKAREVAYRDYFDLKIYIAKHVSAVCSHEHESLEAKNECGDVKNIDNGVQWLNIRDGVLYPELKWPPLPSKETKEFRDTVNRRLASINEMIPAATTADSVFEGERRINFLFVAGVLVVLALAGSISEAVYQLALAIAQRKARDSA
jgi:hypothetical protein